MRFVDWEGRLKNKGDPGNHGGLDPGMWVIDNNNLSNVVIIYDVEDGSIALYYISLISGLEMCPQVVGENSHFGRGKGKNLS